LAALEAALRERRGTAFARRLAERSRMARETLARLGVPVLAEPSTGSPAVLTLPVPAGIPSLDAGSALEAEGILLNYRSAYLADRNWLQVCLMADHSGADMEFALRRIAKALGK
jgi:aspartate aminotransferase-like enzyme